jgi:site-specific recombinase XerD
MDKMLVKAVHNRKGDLLPNGTALIQIEAYLRGKKKYFSTNIYVKPTDWDKKHRQVKAHFPNAIRLNKQIRAAIESLESVELKARNQGKPFTLDMLSQYNRGELTDSFTEFMAKEIERSTNNPTTTLGHKVTLKSLRAFKSNVLFDELNYNLLDGFKRFLKDRNLHTNTINKYFRHLRTYCNLAIKRGLMDANAYPFRNFELESQETQRGYLTPLEIELIENLHLPPEQKHLDKIRDMFLFSCYSGLRFKDVTALTADNFIIENDKEYLRLTMQKVKQQISLPIFALFNGKPSQLAKKYIQTDRKYIFDEFTNQHVNRCLKDIAKLAGISKTVHFHMARHTCGTFLIYKGVDVLIVKKILGHKKLETTLIYAKVMDATMENALQKVSF